MVMLKEIRETLLREYRAAKLAQKYDEAFSDYETPYGDIYGLSCDAICCLIGENCMTFDDTVTCKVLQAKDITEEQAVNILFGEFMKNIGALLEEVMA